MHPIIDALYDLRNDEQRAILMRFFKTGPGQYGEGDQFLGIKIPEVRLLAKESRDLPLEEIPELLTSEWHEVRLCGFLILTYKMEYLCRKRVVNTLESMQARDAIVRLYLQYADCANNWDLVDLSAPKIIGPWLLLPTDITSSSPSGEGTKGVRLSIMDSLAYSPVLWRQRIAMVSTWKTTQQGDPTWALRYTIELLPEYERQEWLRR